MAGDGPPQLGHALARQGHASFFAIEMVEHSIEVVVEGGIGGLSHRRESLLFVVAGGVLQLSGQHAQPLGIVAAEQNAQ